MERQFDIWRDNFGIPHINSNSTAGVFHGLGYAHGRDRGTQTVFMKTLGQGRTDPRGDAGATGGAAPRRALGAAGARLFVPARMRAAVRARALVRANLWICMAPLVCRLLQAFPVVGTRV